ncbi:MAG: prolipoprotein diacylglyceryl transferase [Gammaproteobacteria bacterium]|nr:prolipoprotein diacylglyceryl transferase [Gammaproteobacteria bacterium]
MLQYPDFNPIAFELGPLKVHWYGIMYIIGFGLTWALGCFRARKPNSGWTTEQVGDLIFYGALGVILGGRTGYMLFYDLPNFIHQPWIIFRVWDGGMSFHGGMLGVALAVWLYARKINKSVWDCIDFAVPMVPLGLAAGRLGNFINGELWGRITHVPWAMVFPKAGPLPRHPSQLYEFTLEGIVLFLILWCFSTKPRPRFAVTALFLLFYGIFRFTLEFFRQPDPQLGFIAFGWLTMGQLLSVPMILAGAIGLIYVYQHKDRSNV